MARVALAIVIVALWIYAIIDCARTAKSSMPGRLPKAVWLIVTIVPVLGSLLWLVTIWPIRHPDGFGTFSFGAKSQKTTTTTVAPDDDPTFLAKLDARNRFAEWEREQAKKNSTEDDLDAELKKLMDDDPGEDAANA